VVALLQLLAIAHAGQLEGAVKELGLNRVIPGAIIDTELGSVETDSRGLFTLDLPDGSHQLTVMHSDYELYVVNVTLPMSSSLSVYLEPGEPPLEVVVEARRDLPHASSETLDRERVTQTPGTHGDAARLIQALPGVAVTREYSPSSGDISIRGAAPGDSKFYLDGVEIPYLFHFQQYASVFQTRLLDEVTIFPSAYGAGYGDAVGGVVNSVSRSPEEAASHGGVSGDLIMGGAWVSSPVGEKVGVSASVRRSYADLMENDSEWYTIWPTFWDYLARAELDLSEGHSIALTGFGAGDRYGRYLQQPEALSPLEREDNPPFVYEREFHAASLRLENQFGSTHISSTVAYVGDVWSGVLTDASQNRVERYGWFRSELSSWFGDDLELNSGLQGKFQSVDLDVITQRAWGELSAAAPMLARGEAVDETIGRFTGGAWVEPRVYLGTWRLQPGIRLQMDSLIGEVQIDPRVSLRGEVSENLRLRGALGRYSQSPSAEQLSPTLGDESLPFATSYQGSVGVDYAYASRLELEAELWGKQLYDLVVENIGEAPTLEDGYAWGVELGARYRLREKFFTAMSLTVGQSMRDSGPFAYDQPFAFSFLTSWNISPKWSLGMRYRFAEGLPYTPIVDGVYNANDDLYEPVFGDSNSVRMPAYQKVDLRIERTWRFRRWSLVGYIEAWYVPPPNNTLYPVYSYDYSEELLVGGPALLPLVGLRGEM